MVRVRAMRTLENAARRWGFYRVAGCDEVGRGCLAGPVVAGAVILNPDVHIAGLADSKTITALERERLHDEITRKALAWSVAAVEPAEIDAINIHRASLEAMRRALMAIAPLPDLVLVDAFRIPDLHFAQRAVLHGDRRCAAIAAARNGAKVTLIQNRSRLGGNSSSEIRMHVCGANHSKALAPWRETGIIEELKLTNAATNPQPPAPTTAISVVMIDI